MTAFVNGSAGFEDFKRRPDLQEPVLRDLVELICKNTRFSCGTTVLAEDWGQVNRDFWLEECHCTPYAVAAFAVINKAIRWIGRPKKDRMFTEFVFEEGDAGRGDFEWLVKDLIKRDPERLTAVRPRFESKKLSPLQSADLSVWEQRNYVREKVKGTLEPDFEKLRPSFRRLVLRPNDWGVMTREQITLWAAKRVGVPKRSEPFDRRTWRPFPVLTTGVLT